MSTQRVRRWWVLWGMERRHIGLDVQRRVGRGCLCCRGGHKKVTKRWYSGRIQRTPSEGSEGPSQRCLQSAWSSWGPESQLTLLSVPSAQHRSCRCNLVNVCGMHLPFIIILQSMMFNILIPEIRLIWDPPGQRQSRKFPISGLNPTFAHRNKGIEATSWGDGSPCWLIPRTSTYPWPILISQTLCDSVSYGLEEAAVKVTISHGSGSFQSCEAPIVEEAVNIAMALQWLHKSAWIIFF